MSVPLGLSNAFTVQTLPTGAPITCAKLWPPTAASAGKKGLGAGVGVDVGLAAGVPVGVEEALGLGVGDAPTVEALPFGSQAGDASSNASASAPPAARRKSWAMVFLAPREE
ncbi:MAG: hypothetical protein E6J29_05905 [Chloroflexi bacterium]|nr:MAG: hypothetical protein E6J29_05905 [Chloroflexota bacterium]